MNRNDGPGADERAKLLVGILTGTSAREDERDDAAMDLESLSGPLVEQALIETIRREGFDSVLAQTCAESLAGIWAREDRIDRDALDDLRGPARDEVLGILNMRAPHLLPDAAP